MIPSNPRAVIEIERPGFGDGQSQVRYDSWETKRLIQQVTVELATNQSSEARVTLFDPKFKVIDTFAESEGKAVFRIYLGYGQDLGEPVFKGVLAQVERGESETRFVIFDMAFVMKLVKKAGYQNKKGDVAIMQGLVTRNGLQFEGPGENLNLEPHSAMTQDWQTDWDWLMERARDAGLVIYVRHDTVFAKKPAKTGTPVMTIENGKDFKLESGWDLIYRTPENLDGRPKVVKHRRRDRDGKFAKGTSDEASRGRDETQVKRDMQMANGKKLTRRAQAQKELDREHAYEGRIRRIALADGKRVDVGDTVDIRGVGKRMSGNYLCRTARYDFGPGTMSIDLEVYRDTVEA